MKIRFILAILVSAVLTGCVSVQYQTPPPVTSTSPSHQLGQSELLAQTNHMVMHINEQKDILYHQNFGGGGAGVGVMFGPLGVAANIAAIKSNTKKDVELLTGKLPFSPTHMFKDVANNQNFQLKENAAGAIQLTPYIYVSKTDDEVLHFSSAMIVETQPGSSTNWVGKYMFQTEIKLPKSDISDGVNESEEATLNKALRTGFIKLIELYNKDRAGELITLNNIRFKSDFVSPRFNMEIMGEQIPSDAERVNIRTVGAIFSLPKDEVEVTVAKQKK